MKLVIIVVLSVLTIARAEFYDTGLLKLDTGLLVQNEEALEAFHGCFMDRVPCGTVPQKIKEVVPEAVREACLKCNEMHKKSAWTYLNHIKTNNPIFYEEFKKKYDPESKYIEAFENAIKNYKVE